MDTPQHFEIEAYDFSVFGLIQAAWERINGVKWIFLAALLAYIVIAVLITSIISIFMPADLSENPMDISAFAASQLQSLLASPVLVPIMTGILMLAIKHARGETPELSSIFNYFIIVWPLVFASIAMNVLIIVGFMLLLLPGIYLSVAYAFALPLMADKGLGIWEALEISRKTVTKRWFKIFGLDMVLAFIIVVSAIPFGIGLIWSIPLAYVSYGLLYHRIFDDVAETAEPELQD